MEMAVHVELEVIPVDEKGSRLEALLVALLDASKLAAPGGILCGVPPEHVLDALGRCMLHLGWCWDGVLTVLLMVLLVLMVLMGNDAGKKWEWNGMKEEEREEKRRLN